MPNDLMREVVRRMVDAELRLAAQEAQESERTVWLRSRLTSTAWNGDPRSTTAKTKLDLSTVFAGYPNAPVRAVYVSVSVRDSDSAATDCLLILDPTNAAGVGQAFRCSGLANDQYNSSRGWIPCDANGDIYYQVVASGAGTLDAWLEIWGYML